MKRVVLVVLFLLGIVTYADAASVSIESPRLEHGVTKGSQQGMRFHFKLNIFGYKGRQMRAVVYLYSQKGVGVKDRNGRYCSSDGQVCFACNFTPTYDNSVYDDFTIFMPIDELHLADGKHEYFCRLYIFEIGKSWIANSDYISFIGTGASQKQSNREKYDHLLPFAGTLPTELRKVYYRNNSGGLASLSIQFSKNFDGVQEFQTSVYYTPNCQMNKGTIIYYIRKYFDSSDNGWVFSEHQQWISSRQGKNSTLFIANDWTYIKVDNLLFDIPISKAKYDELVPKATAGGSGYNGGGYNSPSGNSYQSGPSHIDKPCGYCGGGGGCSSCRGTGYKYNPYSGYHDRCPSCNGSGRCFNCRGTGKQATY